MDGIITKAPLGKKGTGANPTDRSKSGNKRSIVVVDVNEYLLLYC